MAERALAELLDGRQDFEIHPATGNCLARRTWNNEGCAMVLVEEIGRSGLPFPGEAARRKKRPGLDDCGTAG